VTYLTLIRSVARAAGVHARDTAKFVMIDPPADCCFLAAVGVEVPQSRPRHATTRHSVLTSDVIDSH